jgi:hypothetical protein
MRLPPHRLNILSSRGLELAEANWTALQGPPARGGWQVQPFLGVAAVLGRITLRSWQRGRVSKGIGADWSSELKELKAHHDVI